MSAAYQISAIYPGNDGLGFSKSRVPVISFCLPVPGSNFATCPQILTETYKGILIGDINGNFSSVSSGLFRKSDIGSITFDLSNAIVSDGYVDVPVVVSSNVSVNALDFEIKTDESKLTFSSMIDKANGIESMINYNTEDNVVRFTSNSLENYRTDKNVVILRFNTNSDNISENDFISMEGFLNGEPVQMQTRMSGISKDKTDDQKVSVYPNPASDNINVQISQDATMQLFDPEGRQVISKRVLNANEKYEFNTDGLANGIYIMKIMNEELTVTRQIIIKK